MTRISFMRPVLSLSLAIALAAPALAQSAGEYVATAGAGDLYERQSSQLVLKTTKNADLRTFAQEMVTDHGKSTADVKAAAAKSGIKPKPPVLNPEQSSMIAQLTKTSGTARDSLYVTQQKTAHQQALTLHQGYAASGDKPALKTVAGKIAPVVQHHLEMLNGMKM